MYLSREHPLILRTAWVVRSEGLATKQTEHMNRPKYTKHSKKGFRIFPIIYFLYFAVQTLTQQSAFADRWLVLHPFGFGGDRRSCHTGSNDSSCSNNSHLSLNPAGS